MPSGDSGSILQMPSRLAHALLVGGRLGGRAGGCLGLLDVLGMLWLEGNVNS